MWDRQHGPAIDDQYLNNRRGMAAGASQLRYRYTYHWLEPQSPVENQVARVWFCMQGFIAQGEGVMLDVEEAGTNAAMALQFCAQMEALIHRPVAVYSGSAAVLSNGWLFEGTRPLIFPHYTPDIEESRKLAARRGAPYLDIVQWSSTGAKVGIPANVDLDQVEAGALDRLEASCGW